MQTPPDPYFIPLSQIGTWIISLSALGVASYSLYLQRRDKRPLLKIELWAESRELPGGTDDYGDLVGVSTPVICLSLSNPTDKEIMIQFVTFRTNTRTIGIVPYRAVESVPSHQRREIVVVVEELHQKIKETGLAGRVDGVFEIRDALDNLFKSNQINSFIPGTGMEDVAVPHY